VAVEDLAKHEITAIILSGGPNSVYDSDAPHLSNQVWELITERKIPVLGICYGMQELAHTFGGCVSPGLKREYGKAFVSRVEGCTSQLLEGLPTEFQMWMSHGDKLSKLPDGFRAVGKNDSIHMYRIAAFYM
jgi:GMP synthase (glutamine-hydrolysing)